MKKKYFQCDQLRASFLCQRKLNLFLQIKFRGYGRTFGQEAINEFCSEFCIEKVIRSHQCIQSGIEFTFCDKLITVFSCSNYCDTCKNQAAYLHINGESIDQFILQQLNILKRNKAIFVE